MVATVSHGCVKICWVLCSLLFVLLPRHLLIAPFTTDRAHCMARIGTTNTIERSQKIGEFLGLVEFVCIRC